MQAPGENKQLKPAGKEVCPLCGRALSDGLCRRRPDGSLYCWSEMKIVGEVLHRPTDTTPAHAKKAAAQFQGDIERAEQREQELSAAYEAVREQLAATVRRKRALEAQGGKLVYRLATGDYGPLNPESRNLARQAEAEIKRLEDELEEAGARLSRARAELGRLCRARDYAKAQAEYLGPSLSDKLRAAIGL